MVGRGGRGGRGVYDGDVRTSKGIVVVSVMVMTVMVVMMMVAVDGFEIE